MSTNTTYYQRHKEEMLKQQKEYRKNNPDKTAEKVRKYRENHKLPKKETRDYYGVWPNHRKYTSDLEKRMYQRADQLARNYRRIDKNKGFSIESNVDGNWIYKNVLLCKCHYCNNDNWLELGCDRKDNTLPHVEDNVVPCCYKCNTDKARTGYDEYINNKGVPHGTPTNP